MESSWPSLQVVTVAQSGVEVGFKWLCYQEAWLGVRLKYSIKSAPSTLCAYILFGILVYNKSFSNKAPDYVKCAILADPIRPLVQCMTQQGN